MTENMYLHKGLSNNDVTLNYRVEKKMVKRWNYQVENKMSKIFKIWMWNFNIFIINILYKDWPQKVDIQSTYKIS